MKKCPKCNSTRISEVKDKTYIIRRCKSCGFLNTVRKNRNLVFKVVFIFFIFLILIFSIYFSYNKYVYPAYLSMQSDCNIIDEIELRQKGFIISGYYSPSTDEICVKGGKDNKKTLRHEYIHRIQKKQGRSASSCDNKIKVFLNELEAYILEDFPIRVE